MLTFAFYSKHLQPHRAAGYSAQTRMITLQVSASQSVQMKCIMWRLVLPIQWTIPIMKYGHNPPSVPEVCVWPMVINLIRTLNFTYMKVSRLRRWNIRTFTSKIICSKCTEILSSCTREWGHSKIWWPKSNQFSPKSKLTFGLDVKKIYINPSRWAWEIT